MRHSTSLSATNGAAYHLLDDLVAQMTDLFLAGDREGIEALLADHPEHADRLSRLLPALELMADLGGPADPSVWMGVLGDFRLLREIGRGGMGVVYEAEQISLGRRVALKVLPFAAAVDPQQQARFRIEAQAAALLHHTHIVPVYAVGCDRGVHYYAMQFIEGRTLAELIRELNSLSDPEASGVSGLTRDLASGRFAPEATTGGVPAPASSGRSSSPSRSREFLRAATRLGVQAAEALEHAHSLGVLHRDIKPANILVDERSHLWIADFGLARLGTEAELTISGHLPGTLRYMSPEQALGHRMLVDGRTDIYSLGVTLYELLTLKPAFDGRDRQALLRQVGFEEPRPLRAINPAIPRDLETILLKAMAKEPERRYARARDLADDLRHFLEHRPIRARRPSPLEHLAKWSRRHRAAVAAAAAILVVATVVGATLLWREQGRTEAARLSEREALRFTFAASDQIASQALRRIATEPVAGQDAEFCRNALAYYEKIAPRYRLDPEMRGIAAAAYHRIGYIRMILGLEGVENAYRRSIPLYRQEASDSLGVSEPRRELAVVFDDLGMYLRRARGLAAAEPCHREALELRRGLAADFPAVTGYQVSLTLTLAYYVSLLADLNRDAEAEQGRQELLNLCESERGLEPGNAQQANQVAWTLASRAGASPRAYRRSVELARRAVELAPQARNYWNTLGVAQYRAGAWQAAIEGLETSMRLHKGSDPYDWLFLAMAHDRLGNRAEARRWYERSFAWIDENAPRDEELRRFRTEAMALRDAGMNK